MFWCYGKGFGCKVRECDCYGGSVGGDRRDLSFIAVGFNDSINRACKFEFGGGVFARHFLQADDDSVAVFLFFHGTDENFGVIGFDKRKLSAVSAVFCRGKRINRFVEFIGNQRYAVALTLVRGDTVAEFVSAEILPVLIGFFVADNGRYV